MDVEIYGKVKDQDFHMVKLALDTLQRTHEGALKVQINALTDTDWEHFLNKKQNEIRGELWGFKCGVMSFIDGAFVGNGDDFMRWAKEKFAMVDFRPPAFYEALGNQAYKEYLEDSDREVIFIDLVYDKRPLGRMIFELYKNLVPETIANFVKLLSAKEGKKYGSSTIHRIVKNGWLQGGDFSNGSGANSESFSGEKFPDENFAVQHNRRGTIGMANDGPHTNGSQFYITFQPAPWMDNKYVAMGYIIEGIHILDDIESMDTYNERPRRALNIHDCGLLRDAL